MIAMYPVAVIERTSIAQQIQRFRKDVEEIPIVIEIHGIKYPVLSFRESFNNITHVSFRIKNDQPIPEYGSDSWALISSDRGSIYGPQGESAYSQITQYLSHFI